MALANDRRPVSLMASCALDEGGLRRQLERYRRLARSVARLDRRDDMLTVDFDPSLDSALLEEALTVERACCPFFGFDVTEDGRRLSVSVEEREQRPALDAIATALGAPTG